MSVSVTRIVKFIRKGERGNSVINAVTPIRRYTLATWQRIGAANYAFTWANISNYADMKIGDTMVIQGVVTDKDNISVTYYGTITTINTTSIRTIATALIMSGTNGSSFAAQYSVDGSTNWHGTFTDGDIYMRTSADGGKTWSAAIKIVGEKGGETNYQFAWSSHKSLDDSEDPLNDVVDWYDYPPAQTDASKPYLWTMITTPDNKVSYARLTGEKGDKGDNGKDAVTIYVDPNTILHKKAASNSTYAVTVKLKEGEKYIDYGTNYGQFAASMPNYSALSTELSCRTVLSSDSIRYNFTIKANAEVNLEAKIKISYKGFDYWRSIPIKTVANGDKGDKGDKGDQGNPGEPGSPGSKGDRGPALRGPQMWNDCGVGYVFQSGADGEEYKDIVLYNNNYYSCTKSHAKTASNYPLSATSNSNSLWRLADKLEIIATKILLAQYALVKNLGVEVIDMKDSAGNIIFQAKDGNVVCNSGTFNNITVKGNSILEGIVKAQLYYSPTKTVTSASSRTYTINPQTEPCCSFLINEPTNSRFVILPKASLYDGLEIQIFTKVSGTWSTSKMTFAKSNGSDSLYVRANAYNTDWDSTTKRFGAAVNNYAAEYKDYKDSSIYMCPNCVCKFKSINGAWYAIEGLYTGE